MSKVDPAYIASGDKAIRQVLNVGHDLAKNLASLPDRVFSADPFTAKGAVDAGALAHAAYTGNPVLPLVLSIIGSAEDGILATMADDIAKSRRPLYFHYSSGAGAALGRGIAEQWRHVIHANQRKSLLDDALSITQYHTSKTERLQQYYFKMGSTIVWEKFNPEEKMQMAVALCHVWRYWDSYWFEQRGWEYYFTSRHFGSSIYKIFTGIKIPKFGNIDYSVD